MLGGKTLKNVKIDPQTTDIWSTKRNNKNTREYLLMVNIQK